jgi:hypothetical protein
VAVEGKVDPGDLALFHVTDDPAEAASIITAARERGKHRRVPGGAAPEP